MSTYRRVAAFSGMLLAAGCTSIEEQPTSLPAESVRQAYGGADVHASSTLRQRKIRVAVVADVNPNGISSGVKASGRIAAKIARWNPRAVAVAGDFQYPYGDCSSLVREFDRTGWGRLMPKVIGAAGPTHDYESSPASSKHYSRHMEGACPGQTSGRSLSARRWNRTVRPYEPHYVDLGAWTVISMPSAQWRREYAAAFGPTWSGESLTRWLDKAVKGAQRRGDHVLAMAHEPYWSSGTDSHPENEGDKLKAWMRVLDRYDVRVVIGGHQHAYERFRPQTLNGAVEKRLGTQQFQVSTGGISLRDFTSRARNSVARSDKVHGYLRLVLYRNGGYTWRFVPVQGRYLDSGVRPPAR